MRQSKTNIVFIKAYNLITGLDHLTQLTATSMKVLLDSRFILEEVYLSESKGEKSSDAGHVTGD